MKVGKNYTVKTYVGRSGHESPEDKREIERLLAEFPLWKREHARDLIARRKMAAHGSAIRKGADHE